MISLEKIYNNLILENKPTSPKEVDINDAFLSKILHHYNTKIMKHHNPYNLNLPNENITDFNKLKSEYPNSAEEFEKFVIHLKNNIVNHINDSADIRSNNILIMRRMKVGKNFFKDITDGTRLGIHWTYDRSIFDEGMKSAFSSDSEWQVSNNEMIPIIYSWIEMNHANWTESLYKNMIPMYGEEEREIQLFKGTPIDIEFLEINNEKYKPDYLKNKTFKA